MSDQQSSNNVAEFFSPGPGERLRAARLSMGFDLAKIASELHLTSAVVEDLEADRYSDIGARVFVRGYLRNYARIVDMPVESILRQFDEKWPDDNIRQSMVRESPTLPADGGPSRGMAGAMTWLLVIGLLVLFLMWWRGYLDEIVPEQIRAGNIVAGGVGSVPEPEQTFYRDEPFPADGSLLLPPGAPDSERLPGADDGLESPGSLLPGESDSPLNADQPVSEATLLDGEGDTTAAAPAAPLGATTVAAPRSSPAVTGVTPVAVEAPLAEGAPVIEGSKQIVMTFNAPCWVDVRDSEREFKLFGEMPKGTRKVLDGQPPYKLVIGNAEAVSITVNGRPFDLSPYAKGNVARFTLDP
jgi:cytoskeleton protein RodZ